MKSPIQSKVNTIFIHVSDLKQSVEWYCNLLGQTYDLSKVERPVYNLDVDQKVGITLDAGPSGDSKGLTPSQHPLFNFHTDDIDLAFDYMKHLDYEISSDIVRFDDFSFFTVQDPDRNVIMICTG
jgi:catechol 2,3-dioxygenase-like lactoylglutathione lyase family enzyme